MILMYQYLFNYNVQKYITYPNAESHPIHLGRVWTSGGCTPGLFLMDLFQGFMEGIPGQEITRLPAKQTGLALQDPTKTAPDNCTATCVITGNLVAELQNREEFKMVDNAVIFCKGQGEIRRRNMVRSEAALGENLTGTTALVARRLRRVTKTGLCLKVQTSTVNRK